MAPDLCHRRAQHHLLYVLPLFLLVSSMRTVASSIVSSSVASTHRRIFPLGHSLLHQSRSRALASVPRLPLEREKNGPLMCGYSRQRRVALFRSFSSTSSSSDASASSSSSSARTGPSASPLSMGIPSMLSDQKFQKLIRDIFNIASEVGVERGLKRGLIGAQAGIRFAAEIAQNPNEYIDPSTSLPSPPKVLRGLFERLGATYIKLGQFIASSPTLFPQEYVLEFQKCLDKTPENKFSTIQKIIEEDLKRPISEVYSRIDPEPIASASVAQVHKGILKATGEEVAIKVRKPGVDAALAADLGFILSAAKIIEYLNPNLVGIPLAGITEDLREAMIGELDFRKEAENLKKFRNFLIANQLTTQVTCPRVIDSASNERVLTMEFMDGVPLIDLENIKKYTRDPEATLVSALNAWSLSVMGNEFFHADVHAGNLLVLKDGRVAFIDFGIVGTIPPKIWDAIQDLSQSLVVGDTIGMAAALVKMGATKSEVDVQKFGLEIKNIIDNINAMDQEITYATDGMSTAAQIQVDQEQVSRLLLDIVQTAENNGVQLPREFGLLVKQALYFDRYTKLLAPNLDVLSDDRIQGFNAESEAAYTAQNRNQQRGYRRGDDTSDDPNVIDVTPLN